MSHETTTIATYHHRSFPPAALAAGKREHVISVCIPARDEEATIGVIVSEIEATLKREMHLVDEILVIDDGSTDATAAVAREAGAEVIAVNDVFQILDAGAGVSSGGSGGFDASRVSIAGPGKGQAMLAAAAVASGDLIVFCDGDVTSFSPHYVTGLLGPLLEQPGIYLVKGFYERPPSPGEPRAWSGQGGGRVTELLARPLIRELFPELAGVAQPLAGETATRRSVLEDVGIASGYGVEMGLLLDVACRYGVGSIAQVDLEMRTHRNRPLAELVPQAQEVLAVVLDRAGITGATSREEATSPARTYPPLTSFAGYRRRAGARAPA